MHKLLALSILLLIGCSPASLDESEITIGRPEKEPDSYPIPIGEWLFTHDSLPLSLKLDFTNRDYKGKVIGRDSNFVGKDALFENPKILFKHTITPSHPNQQGEIKGYWVTTKDKVSKENIYYLFYINEDSEEIYYDLRLDRGDLIDLRKGFRYKKVK